VAPKQSEPKNSTGNSTKSPAIKSANKVPAEKVKIGKSQIELDDDLFVQIPVRRRMKSNQYDDHIPSAESDEFIIGHNR
jgi:hypothetical protein